MADEKPTLMQARRNYNYQSNTHITTKQLADIAHVPLADVYMMEIGRPISEENAYKVLRAFLHLTGKRLSLSEINVSIKPEAQALPTWMGSSI